MGPLRTICILALLSCAATCGANGDLPPDPAAPAERDPLRLPVLIDAAYNWRVQPTQGWHGVDAMLRLPLDRLGVPHGRYHQLAIAGWFETGYAYNPNPTRAGVMLGYSWGVDTYEKGDDSHWRLFGMDQGFPVSRTPVFSYGLQMLAGFHSSVGTGGSAREPRSVDAFRLEIRGAVGAVGLQPETRLAVHLNLRTGRFVDGEFYTGLLAGRPMLPLGIRLGWGYLFTQRGGGGFFVLGFVVAF